MRFRPCSRSGGWRRFERAGSCGKRLTEGDGEDPEKLLLRALPLHVVEQARRALWGPSWRDGEVPEPDHPLASA